MKPGTLVIPAACLAVFVLLGRAGDQVPADGQAPKPPADQIALLEETVSAIEKARGPDDFTLLRPLETMGTAFRNAGREAEAEACFRRSLEIFRKQGGKDVRTEVRLLDCVVVSLLGQEKNAEAEKLVLEAGRLLGNLDAPCDAEIAVLSGNLGIVQERLGKLGDAEMSLRQAVNIEEKLDGPPDRRVIPMLNLAGLLARRENFREAEYQTMQVMELLDGGGEENSLLMARCLFHLAVHLMSQECYGEALDACRKAVDLQRRLRGPDHDDIAASLGLLSSILVRQEKLAEAAASCREAMEMRRKLHGPDSPMVVQEMRELALILGRQQKHAEAKELWCEALAVCRRLPAPPADLTAKTLRGLAEELSRQGQDSVAEPHFIEATTILEKLGGDNNEALVRVLAEHAESMIASGRMKEAGAVAKRAAVLLAGLPRSATEERIAMVRTLGRVEEKLRHPQQARDLQAEAAKLTAEAKQAAAARAATRRVWNAWNMLDEERSAEAITECGQALALDPKSASARTALGRAHQMAGHPEKALEAFREAVRLAPQDAYCCEQLGEYLIRTGHRNEALAAVDRFVGRAPEDSRLRYDAGVMLEGWGEADKALASYREAVRFRSDHALALNNIGANLSRKGKLEEGLEFYQKALSINPLHVAALRNLEQNRKELERRKQLPSEQAPAGDTSAPKPADEDSVPAQDVLTRLKQTRDPEDTALAGPLMDSGLWHQKAGRFPEAEQAFRSALEIVGQSAGAGSPEVIPGQIALGSVLLSQGKVVQAERWFRANLEILKKQAPQDMISLGGCWSSLGECLYGEDRCHEAEAAFRQSLDCFRKAPAAEPAQVENSLRFLALCLVAANYRFQEAETCYAEAIESKRKRLGLGHLDLASELGEFGFLLTDDGKAEEGEKLGREAVALARQSLRGAALAVVLSDLGMSLRAQGKGEEALALLVEALDLCRKDATTRPRTLAFILDRCAQCRSSNGPAREAALLAAEAVALQRKETPLGRRRLADYLDTQGCAELDLGHEFQARRIFHEAETIRKKLEIPVGSFAR